MNLPVPNVMDDWAKAARGNNFVVRGNEAVFEIATREIDRQRAGHYPTVDVVTSYTRQHIGEPERCSARATTINQGQVGLQLSATDLRWRLGALAHPRGGRAEGEGAAGPRSKPPRGRVQRAPVVPQRHQRARAGEGARASARFERDRAAIEPGRLRGRGADQHRRPERAAAGLPDQARSRPRTLRHDPERAAAQVGRGLAHRGRRRGGQRAARLRPVGAVAVVAPAAQTRFQHVPRAGDRAGRARHAGTHP